MIGGSEERTADAIPLLQRVLATQERLTTSWQSVSQRAPWTFIIIVALPTLLTAVYMFLIAAPIYVSEAQFVVRSQSGHSASSLGIALAGFGVSGGSEESYEVDSYIMSRSALQRLVAHHDFRRIVDRPEADFIAQFPRFFERNTFENLFEAYDRFVTVSYDTTTGVNTLRVSAFRPEDAHRIASALLNGAENLVNELNDRTMDDSIALAWKQVDQAQKRALRAEDALTAFRTKQKMIDPTAASSAGSKIVDEIEALIVVTKAQRDSVAALAPESPMLPELDQKIRALRDLRSEERAKVAGESDSLASKIGEYERLVLERDFAKRTLENANEALVQAQIDARKKQTYIDRIAAPNIADQADLPHRFTDVVLVFVSAFVAYATIMLVVAGLREHRQM